MTKVFLLIIESILFAAFYFIYFEQTKRPKRWILTIYYFVVFYIGSLFLWIPGNTYYLAYLFAYYLACFLGLIVLAKEKTKTLIGLVFVPNFIILSIYLVISLLFHLSLDSIIDFGTLCILFLLQFIAVLFIAKYMAQKKTFFELDEFIMLGIDIVLLHANQFYILNYTLFGRKLSQDIVTSMFCIIGSVFLFFITSEIRHSRENRQAIELERMSRQVDLQNKYMESQEQLHLLKHDVQHILSTLSDSSDLQDDPKIQKCKEELANISIPLNTGNKTLDIILNMKRDSAKEKGIDMFCSIDQDVSYPLNDEDLSLLMINLLDNAIDHIGTKKRMKVSLKQEKEYLVILVDNVVDTPLELTKVKDYVVPVLYENGYGIKTVLNIVQKQNGLIEYKNEDGWLSCKILI